MTEPDPYWAAVDDLAVAIRLAGSEQSNPQLVDKLLDVDHELLNRVVTNYGTDAYLAICERVGITEPVRALQVVLHPALQIPVVPTVTFTDGEFLLGQIYAEIDGTGSSPNSTAPLLVHLSYESAVSPAAVVLNTAFGSLVTLTMKLQTLVPGGGPLDQSEPGSQYSKAIDLVIEHMRARINQ